VSIVLLAGWLASVVVCRLSSSCVVSYVTLLAHGPAGCWECGNAAWECCWRLGRTVGAQAAGRAGGRAADTAWRASRDTSHYGDTLFDNIYLMERCIACLAADFRLQILDSAARIESPEYVGLQLKPVCFETQQTRIWLSMLH